MKKRFIEWGDIDEAINKLATNILNNNKKIKAIIGLPRGGLIPAVMLSHKLKVPLINDDNDMDDNGYILIVDDICDSGKTLEEYKNYKYILTATLHYKNSASVEPNFWWKLAGENEWIVYPWEQKDSKTIADYAAKGK